MNKMVEHATNLHGASGQIHRFETVKRDGDWLTRPGIAVFAFRSAFYLTVVSVVEVTGREGDFRPFSALTRAEFFGADMVFFLGNADVDSRAKIADDIREGMNPLCRELPNAA